MVLNFEFSFIIFLNQNLPSRVDINFIKDDALSITHSSTLQAIHKQVGPIKRGSKSTKEFLFILFCQK